MAVSTLVELSDLKTLLDEVSGAGSDTLLNMIIAHVSQRFEGETRRKLLTQAHTAEKYDGNGSPVLMLKQWPVTAVAAAVIEDEAAIDESDDDVLRYYPDGRVVLVARSWSKPSGGKVQNISMTYTAGYADLAAFKDYGGMPDAHALLTDACVRTYRDLKQAKGGRISNQSHSGGSISYFADKLFSTDWARNNWQPVVAKYKNWRL